VGELCTNVNPNTNFSSNPKTHPKSSPNSTTNPNPNLQNTVEKTYIYIQCVSKKNIPDIFSCNSREHCRIFIMFGTHVTEKVSNQQML